MGYKVKCSICEEQFNIQKGIIIPAIINGTEDNIICCNNCFNKDDYEKNIEIAKEIVKEDNNETKN